MKKFLAVFFAIVIVAACAIPAFAYDNEEFYKRDELAGTTLNVFNWGENISDKAEDGLIDVNSEFEKLTGVTVNYTTYPSNEDLYAKLSGGGTSYDIIIPSDYMIEKLISEDKLQKINMDNIPNFKNISDEYKGMYFDPDDEYSIAYGVGFVGLIYNKTMVSEPPTSWSALWDEQYKGKALMFDNYRDSFAVAEALLGYSINTEDPAELEAVATKLLEQKPLLQSYVMDEVYNKMEAGEAAIAPYYVGDFLCMKENNSDLELVYPEEGVNIFVDSICMPKDAQNVAAAELYINFLLDPEVGLSNALCTNYATPNTAVFEMEEYSEMANNKYLYPDVMPKTEYFHNLSVETLDTLSTHWDNVKRSGENNTTLYIGIAVVAVIAIAFIVFKSVQKKRREA